MLSHFKEESLTIVSLGYAKLAKKYRQIIYIANETNKYTLTHRTNLAIYRKLVSK